MSLPTNQDKSKDRRWFKTPYFKIEVAEPSGPYQELPMQLLKLITVVEISEFISAESISQIKLMFTEGSREPFLQTDETPATIYDKGGFHNSSGFIPDLKVLSSDTFSGFTSLATEFVSDAISQGGAALDAVGLGGLFSPKEILLEDRFNINNNKPVFLFSPRNKVRVTWGYLEDPENQRKFSGSITIVRTDFPENGQPQTEVIAHCPVAEAEQIVPSKGTAFKSTSALATFASSLGQEDEDMSIDTLLDFISENGFDVIRSDSFTGTTVDAGKFKVWPAGQTLNQFLMNLASDSNVYYNMLDNPVSGKPTIVFIKRSEVDAQTIVPSELMTYKGPGSILKSVKITADYTTISKETVSGIAGDGSPVEGKSSGQVDVTLFKGQKIIDTDSTEGANASLAGKAIKSLASSNSVTGQCEYTPACNTPANALDTAAGRATPAAEQAVVLEFSTIGYTKITTGSCPFKGLGRRYSGVYSITQVSHIIDSNGYTCTGSATGASHGGEGINTPGIESTELSPPKSVAVKLFNDIKDIKTPSGGSSSLIDAFKSLF